MTTMTYPTLPESLELRFRAMELAGAINPNYFCAPDCPYSEALKKWLVRLYAPTRGLVDAEQIERIFNVPEGDKFDVLLKEIEDNIETLRELNKLSDLEPSDKIQIIKTRASLADKWVEMKREVYSMQELVAFQKVVLSALDEELDVDQRGRFREKLRAAGLKSI